MRLTLVADNTTSHNWGCRGTSFALRELLSRDHEIVATITRNLIGAPLTHDSRLPGTLHWTMVRRYRRKRLARMPVIGPLAIRAIDTFGATSPPTHDIAADADLLWCTRDTSPKARQIVAKLDACDAIVVNGEGETIFSTPARDTLLQTLAICVLAERMGKRIFYVNGMISKGPDGSVNRQTVDAARGVLPKAKVAVRDHHSIAVAAELLPGIDPPFFADALFTWRRHFADTTLAPYDASRLLAFFDRTGATMPAVANAPYVVISGSSAAARDQARAADRYTALAEGLKALGVPLLLVATCIGDAFLTEVAKRTGLPLLPVETPMMAGAAVMANARLLVSGRWHPSILAALGGTPCVFMGSNSHKTLSLQHLLDYDDPIEFDAFPGEADIAAMLDRSRAALAGDIERRAQVAAAAAKMDASAQDLRGFVR